MFNMAVGNENDERVLRAMGDRDFETLKELLKNPDCHRLGSQRKLVLSVAMTNFNDPELVQFLISNGCDLRESDINGDTALHLLISNRKESCNGIVDILLAPISNVVETVFTNRNKSKMTPFLLACARNSDAIKPLLGLLDRSEPLSIDHFIGHNGNNVFHLLFNYFWYLSPPPLVETVQALIDRIPCSDQLIDAKTKDGLTPLHRLLMHNINKEKEVNKAADVVKLFLQRGARPDTPNRDNGATYLDWAISAKHVSLVETLLRAGCSIDTTSLASLVKEYPRRQPRSVSLRIIDLLLAFGFDLQKELYLYTIDELPSEFTSPEYADRRSTKRMDPDVLRALREVRRSNVLLSLQRQCRNAFRRHFKGQADQVIGNLDCIPDRMKSFLMIENEEPLFDVPQW